MKPKERVLRRYAHAGCMLSAMWGYRIIDYGINGDGSSVLSGARAYHKTEGRAWSAAARRLVPKGWRK